MPLFLRRLGVACAIAIAPLLAHCGDDGRGDDDDDVAGDDDDDDVPALVSIALEPATLRIDVDTTATLEVLGNFDDETSSVIDEGLVFASSAEETASVDAAGTVTGESVGTAVITAMAGDLSAEAEVRVVGGSADGLVVFDDDFASGVTFTDFRDAINDVSVDSSDPFEGTSALRMPVSSESFAGGSFILDTLADASGFDAISFWIKASSAHVVDVVGFGDLIESDTFKTERRDLLVTTEWTNYLMPIPDPSKLEEVGGLFHIAEGNDEGVYDLFLDDIRYVSLDPGVISNPRPTMADESITRFVADTFTAGGTRVVYEVDGVDVTVTPTPVAFFDFVSSNDEVVAVGDDGVLAAMAEGEADVTATLAGVAVSGTLTVTVLPALGPTEPAPTPPVRAASDVISLFSNAYDDVTVDTFRTPWSDGRTTLTEAVIMGDDVLKYTDLVFVGIETLAEPIDTTGMTHFHFDVFIEDPTPLVGFTSKLVDLGTDGVIEGGDDSDAELIFTPTGIPSPPAVTTGVWQSFDIALSEYEPGGETDVGALTSRAQIGQMLFTGNREPAPTPVTVWIDNIYFYR